MPVRTCTSVYLDIELHAIDPLRFLESRGSKHLLLIGYNIHDHGHGYHLSPVQLL